MVITTSKVPILEVGGGMGDVDTKISRENVYKIPNFSSNSPWK